MVQETRSGLYEIPGVPIFALIISVPLRAESQCINLLFAYTNRLGELLITTYIYYCSIDNFFWWYDSHADNRQFCSMWLPVTPVPDVIFLGLEALIMI